MDDNLGPLIPIVFIVFVFGSWIVSRMLKHRERMAMLRMGIIPPRDLKRWQKRGGPGFVPPNMGMQPPPAMGMGMGMGAPEGLGGIETKAEAEAGAEAEDATPEAAA